MNKIDGKKTYGIAVLTAAFGLLGMLLGKFDLQTGMNYLLAAGGMIGFRSALNK